MKVLSDREVWFVTGSQALYGDDVLRTVGEHATEIACALDEAGQIPVRIVAQAGPRDRAGDPRGPPRGNGRSGVHRRHRLDAHVLARPDVDRGTPAAPEAAASPAHAAQPRSPVGGDRHGLHEPQPVGPRRPRVRVPREPPAAQPDDGRRPLAGSGGHRPGRRLGPRRRAASHELRRLRLARFGDNMRHVAVTEGDKVEAQIQLGVRVDGLRRRRPRRRRRRRPPTPTSTGSSTSTTRAMTWRRRCGATAIAGRRFATPPGSRSGCGPSSKPAASAPSPTRSRTSATSSSCPGIAAQRLMAEGYGFGAEGDWKTALLVRAMKVMATGLPGGTSFMEDYTYHLAPTAAGPGGAHARGLPVDRGRAAVLRDPSAVHREPRGPRAPGLHRPARAGRRRRSPGSRRPLPAGPRRDRCGRAARGPAAPAGCPRALGAPARPQGRGRVVAARRRSASHRASAPR